MARVAFVMDKLLRKIGVNGEFGFVTPVMTEGEYEEKAKAYPEILHMIRVEEEV